MRLKEIKPEMAVHCKSDDEKKALLEEAERLGYVWYSTKNKPTERSVSGIGNTIHFYDAGTSSFSSNYKHITHSCQTGDFVTEFSDLIIPELTAEEVLQICTEICDESACLVCPFGEENCFNDKDTDKSGIVAICEKWKSDHEKKEPKIETVDICRIIEILPDGRKRCVREEDINVPELPFGVFEQQRCEEILKRYCMEHDGEFIAVHEVVSRVKAVE